MNEGRTAGIQEGRAAGILETLLSLVNKGLLDKETAAKEAGMKLSELKACMNNTVLPAGMK